MTLPPSMMAISISGKGGPEVLQPVRIPVPTPHEGQVQIKVAAAGVNRPDVLQRLGHYPAPKGHSELPGLEVAGSVSAVGAGVTRWTVGEQVMALVNGGGYAEFCIAEEGSVLKVPAGLSMTEAAAIPETFFTVWHNVFERGALKPGEWFLVHGGTSGIGVTAIQIAKALGSKIIATAESDKKCAACVSLGADRAVNYRNEDFSEAVKEATDGRGVDVILDMVGGDYIDKNIRALADDGRLVNIAYLKGSRAEVDFMRVMLKRLTITGSTLRVRSQPVKTAIAEAVVKFALPLITAGKVKIVIDKVYPLTEAASAHALMESNQHIGKIVLKVA